MSTKSEGIVCLCSYFAESVLDIFNSFYVLINGTIFEHNIASGIDDVSYRGNSGGVAFGYNNIPSNQSMLLQVVSSIFMNNSATATSSFRSSTNLTADKIYTGRGGALAVYKSELALNNLTIIIRKCIFAHNYARSHGGGMYLHAFTKHLLVEETTITYNTAGIGGGGIAFWYPQIIVNNCTIANNMAFAGGGIFVETTVFG